MKKLIGFLVASVMAVQAFAGVAYSYNDAYVDGVLQVREGDSDGAYEDTLTTEKNVVDYQATLDLAGAREAYTDYYDAALEGAGNLQISTDSVKNSAVSGSITITLNFPAGMTVPASFLSATGMAGIVDSNADSIYEEVGERKAVTNSDNSTSVTITAKVKDGIKAEALKNNAEAYFSALTLNVDDVEIASAGVYTVSGDVKAEVSVTTEGKTKSIKVVSRKAGTQNDAISATVTVEGPAPTLDPNTKVTAPEIEITTPEIAPDANIAEEDKAEVEAALGGLEVQGISTSVVENIVKDMLVNDTNAKANLEKFKADHEVGSDANVYVHTKVTVDVKAKAYEANETSKKYTVDITPKYELIASTDATSTENGEVIDEGELDTTNKDVTVIIPLPEGFAEDGTVVYVSHKNNDIRKKIYTCKVAAGKISFVNNLGFSEFEVTTEVPADMNSVASIGDAYYETLQDAVDVVAAGETILLLSDQIGDVVVNKVIKFTIDPNGTNVSADTLKGIIKGATNYTVAISKNADGTFAVNVTKKTTIGGSSASGGGGSVKPSPKPVESAAPAESGAPVATDMPANTPAAGDGNVTAPGSFVDVTATDWFYSDVEYAVEKGFMNGIGNSEFGPNMNITRAMFVTIIYRMAGQPEGGANPFADVSADAYYANAVAWANANGIVTGYSDTEFVPDGNITREQMAAILYRYATYKGVDTTVAEGALNYVDAGEISEYAVSAMQWVCASGVMNGNPDGTLAPQDTATRAQAAAVFGRFDKQFN